MRRTPPTLRTPVPDCAALRPVRRGFGNSVISDAPVLPCLPASPDAAALSYDPPTAFPPYGSGPAVHEDERRIIGSSALFNKSSDGATLRKHATADACESVLGT